jgi:UDP-N-acetyl-D-glucosamine dehydrogenase
MKSKPLENLGQYDCILIVTDHSSYDYREIVGTSRLVLNTRNATKGIDATNLVRC